VVLFLCHTSRSRQNHVKLREVRNSPTINLRDFSKFQLNVTKDGSIEILGEREYTAGYAKENLIKF